MIVIYPTFFFFSRYDDAIDKYDQALETESQVWVYMQRIRTKICHCHSKVSAVLKGFDPPFCFTFQSYYPNLQDSRTLE